jgi:proline iminopeptidase
MDRAELSEPFDVTWLDVGDGHTLYVEQVGRPDGTPILLLHGGPGSGWSERARGTIDPERQRAVLFDQRSAGRSRPHASEPDVHWDSIDLDHHLADIETIREHLGIDRWAVFGASWGSVLGIVYAERYPQRVTAVVAAAVSTGTRRDIDWLTVDAGRFFPEEWEAFREHIPERLRHLRLVEAYRQLVMDPDPAIHEPAARAWCDWEDRHVRTAPSAGPDPRYDAAAFRLGFARQVTHCWANDSWLGEDELVANAHRLAGIPGWLVHGRLDVSSPLDGPWRLHRAWPGSELVVIDDEGHGGPTMQDTWGRLIRAV